LQSKKLVETSETDEEQKRLEMLLESQEASVGNNYAAEVICQAELCRAHFGNSNWRVLQPRRRVVFIALSAVAEFRINCCHSLSAL